MSRLPTPARPALAGRRHQGPAQQQDPQAGGPDRGRPSSPSPPWEVWGGMFRIGGEVNVGEGAGSGM
eukprot:8126564-Pyramimonas_sp.AAC.1